jgi:tetratricopeptide (TPR) repeat protein
MRAVLRDHGNLFDPMYQNAVRAEIARAEGRYLDAVQLWGTVPAQDPLARGERIGVLYLAAGDASRAMQAFAGAERSALDLLQREPGKVDLAKLALVQSMMGKHAEALANVEKARKANPESRDALNGAGVSFVRAVILVRAGQSEEGYAEVTRLLHVPFGAPIDFMAGPEPVRMVLKDDPRFDELLNRPPRL